LNTEYTRFTRIDKEFTTLMKKVSDKQGRILDVLAIKGVLKTLESLSEMLEKI
jgi:hypothetical protein